MIKAAFGGGIAKFCWHTYLDKRLNAQQSMVSDSYVSKAARPLRTVNDRVSVETLEPPGGKEIALRMRAHGNRV